MPQLDNYFRDEADAHQYDHPLINFFTTMAARSDFQEAKLEVTRPRAVLGYRPTKMHLHFYAKSGQEMDRPQPEDWDHDLNASLIQRNVRAISVDNEKLRFSLSLRDALERAEIRFGDGYYNAALIHHIQNSPFKDHPAVAKVLPHIHRNGVDPSLPSYPECRNMIDGAIRGRARELTKCLSYAISEAEDILASALVQYLDDRFSVTNRRLLGWL